MQIVVTTQPAPLVTLAEASVALGESSTDRQAYIEGLILAAQAKLDGPKGTLGISVAVQTISVVCSSFDCPPIRLPGGPITSDIEIVYLDGDGTEVTLDTGDFVVLSDGTIALPEGGSWPTIADQGNAITLTYDVGIEDEDDPRIQQMKTAIIMEVRKNLDMADPEAHAKAIDSLTSSLWVPSV